MLADVGGSGRAADSVLDETSVNLNLPTGCNETQNNDVVQLCPSSSAPPSNQAPKGRRQTQKRVRNDSAAVTSQIRHKQNHTDQPAASDITSASTSHDNNHLTTRSSARIRAINNVDSAVRVSSQTRPRRRPFTKHSSNSPPPKKKLLI